MYGHYILCGIWNGTFDRIFHQYIKKSQDNVSMASWHKVLSIKRLTQRENWYCDVLTP